MAPEEQNPKLLSPLTLAFVGDGVYELLVRKRIVEAGSMPPKKLNAHKVEMVRGHPPRRQSTMGWSRF